MGLVFPEGIEIVQDYFIEVIKHAVFKQLSAFLNFQLLGKKEDQGDKDEKTYMTKGIHEKMNEIFKGKQNFKSLDIDVQKSFDKNSSDKCSICNAKAKPKNTNETSYKPVYESTTLGNVANFMINRTNDVKYVKDSAKEKISKRYTEKHKKQNFNPKFNTYACKHTICTNCFLPTEFDLRRTVIGGTFGNSLPKCLSIKNELVKSKDNKDTDNKDTDNNQIQTITYSKTNDDHKYTIDSCNDGSKCSKSSPVYNCCPICNSAIDDETPIPNILINNNYKPAAVTASNQFMKDIFDKKYKLAFDCVATGGRVTKKKKPLKRKSRKQNIKKKNRSRKRQHKTRKKRTLRRKALKIVKKRLIIGGTDTDKELTEDQKQKIEVFDREFNLKDGMKEMKKNKYNNNDEEKGKYKAMNKKLGKIKIDINDKLKLYEDACKEAATTAATPETAAPAEGEEAKDVETAAATTESTYNSDIDKIKEKTIDRYRDEYRNFESNYTKKMYEKEQKHKRNQEDIKKLKTSADEKAAAEKAAAEKATDEKAAAEQAAENNETVKKPMDTTDPINSYQILQNQELEELQVAHENDKKILQQQHDYDKQLLLIDWYEYFLNELHTLMIKHPDIEDKDKKDLVNKKAQYNLNMKNNRTMKESGRNMMNKMSSTVNRIKQLYNQNKSVDGEEDEKEGNKGCCTRTPYHDAVTTFDQVYESCVAMIEGFFGVGDEGANNPIIEKVKKILISCIQTYLQFHLEKCMEEHIGTLLIEPPPEKSTYQKFKENLGFRGGGEDDQETLPQANPVNSLDVIAANVQIYEGPDNDQQSENPTLTDSNAKNLESTIPIVNNEKPDQKNGTNKGKRSENPTLTDSNAKNPKSTIPIVNNENSDQNINGQKPAEPPKSTTTHAEVIKNQVEEILNKNAIDRCIALHKNIDFKKK